MDPVLYKCITEGDIVKLKEIISVELLLKEISGNGDTTLHVAVQYETKSIVQELCNTCPALLLRQNMKGDTPLHMAAREGLTEIAEVLLSCAGVMLSDVESGAGSVHPKQLLVRMGNTEMDTAFHDAARNDNRWIVKLLAAADPEFECVANKSGKTPLYLAVEQGSYNVVKEILENRLLSAAHYGPDGKTALHAAVICNYLDIARILLEQKPELVKDVDEKGWTALHFAIAQSNDSMISLLLRFDRYMGYMTDKDGSTALHFAANGGKVEAINTILHHCPDSWGMLNKRGQNILHIAVESKNTEVIKHIFQSSTQMIKRLANDQDNDGNTPFHLSAKRSTMVDIFKGDDNVKKDVKNKENLTALDFLHETEELGDEEDDPWADKEVLRLKEHGQIALIVAGLTATVTFSAGVALPGGYLQDGPNKGKAVLSEDGRFLLFMVTNYFILACSIYGMAMYYTVLFQTKKAHIVKFYHQGSTSMSFALGALLIDLMLSYLSVLPTTRQARIIALIINCITAILVAFIVTIWHRLSSD